MLKLALVNPMQQSTTMDTLQRGDEVHPPLIANPYQLDPKSAGEYENGYQYAQQMGHLTLISVPPEQLLSEANGSVPWREGFAASARALGAGQVADTIEATIAPKTAGMTMDLTKLAYGYMQGLRYGAGIGAGLGAVKGLATGESLGDVAKDTLQGAAAGGALGSISSPLVNKARGMFGPKAAPAAAAVPPVAQGPAPTSIPDAPVLGPQPGSDVMPIKPRFEARSEMERHAAAPLAAAPHIDPLARMPAHFFAPGASLAPRTPPKTAPGTLPHGDVQHLLSQLPKATPAQQPRFGVSMDPPMLGLSKIALIRPVGTPGMTASFNRFAGLPAAKPKNITPTMAPSAPPVAAGISHPGGKQSVPVFDVMKPGMPEVGRKVAMNNTLMGTILGAAAPLAAGAVGGAGDVIGENVITAPGAPSPWDGMTPQQHLQDVGAGSLRGMAEMAPAVPATAAIGAGSGAIVDALNRPKVPAKVAEADKKPEGFFAALKDEVGKAKDSLIEGSKSKARGKDRLFRAAFGMKPREAKTAGCGASDAPKTDYTAKIKAMKERRGEADGKIAMVPMAGGKAEGRDPSEFDQEQLAKGVKVEMEHTSDEAQARRIAMDHLSERADYYSKLEAAGLADELKTASPVFAPMTEKDAGMLGNVLGGAGIGAMVPIAAGALGGAGLGAGTGAMADFAGLDHLPLVGEAMDAGHGAVAGGAVGAGLGSTFAPMGAAVGSVAGAGKSVYDATKPKPVPAFATVN